MVHAYAAGTFQVSFALSPAMTTEGFAVRLWQFADVPVVGMVVQSTAQESAVSVAWQI
jgi:hypothetical protein